MKARRTFGAKQPSKARQRLALQGVLLHRASLDRVDVEGLARSYGVKPGEVAAMVADERNRRGRV
jgi:hypothetical protein